MVYIPAALLTQQSLVKQREAARLRQFRYYHKTQLAFAHELVRRADEELARLKQAESPDRLDMINAVEARNKATKAIEEHTHALRTRIPRDYNKVPEFLSRRIMRTVEAHVKEALRPDITQVIEAETPVKDEDLDFLEEYLAMSPEELQKIREEAANWKGEPSQ